MPLVARRKYAQLQRPLWPFRVNWRSRQAYGLVHWWPGGHQSYLTAYDAMGTYHGAPQNMEGGDWNTNKDVGYCWSFGGTNEYYDCGDMPALDSVANFTLTFWARRNATNNTVGVGKGTSGAARLGIVSIVGTWYGFVSDTAGTEWGSFNQNDANWHHFALVFNGGGAANADRLKVYQDGVNQTLSFTGTISATTPDSGSFFIGRAYDASSNPQYTTGDITDVRIYNRSLEAEEVLAIYSPLSRWELYDTSRPWYVIPEEAGAAPDTFPAELAQFARQFRPPRAAVSFN